MSTMSASTGSFVFVAARTGGGRKMGLRQAPNERMLADQLRREKLLLLRSYRLPKWATKEQGLSLKDRAELNDQLAQLLSRVVPLVEALEVTASAVGGGAKPIIEKMRELVAAGSSFADACTKVGSFDRVTVAVYRGAERTGDLAGASKQLATNARRQLAVGSKAATLMIYPLVVMTIAIFVSTMMLTVIVPRIGAALKEMKIPLPWYSRLVMGLGDWMRDNWMFLAIGAGAVVIGVVVGRKAVGAAVRRLFRKAPLFKDVALAQETARFFSVMAAMTRSGVPLADALGVANDAVGLPILKKQLVTLRQKLIEGGVLRTLIENVSALPLATRRLLIAAERSGDLEQAFDGLAADMADEVDRKATRMLAALEPLLIVAMFLVIGTILLSIMIPLITLTSKAI